LKLFLDELRSRAENPRILIRFPNWIGDAVMALPGLLAIRKSCTGATIHVLSKPWVSDIVRLSPAVDEVVHYLVPGEHEKPMGKLRLAGSLKGKYDAAILFQNAIEAAIIAFTARIPLRGGYNTDHRSSLLTHPVPCSDKKGGGAHQVFYYLDLVQALGFGSEVSPYPKLEPDITEDNKPAYVTFAPGASFGTAKMWPARNYAELGRILVKAGYRVVIVGSESEKQVCGSISDNIGDGAEDLSGKTTMTEAAGILAGSSLVVSNDSGLMHVASAVGVPVLALFGSTEPSATGPYSDQAHILRGSAPCAPCFLRECTENLECYDDLTVSVVEEECWQILSGDV